MRIPLLLVVSAFVALAVSPMGSGANLLQTLHGSVGPGFKIVLDKQTVKAGTYTIVVKDLSTVHDFHFTGPGVNKATTVPGTGTTTWTVKLAKGTYKYVCDPHQSFMHGQLRVT